VCASAFPQGGPGSDHSRTFGSVDLSAYSLSGGPFKIKGFDNVSGITFSSESKTLFVINDSPQMIIEIEPNGDVRRRIKLKGSDDPEGITYVRDNVFALVEEDSTEIFVFKIDEQTKKIDLTKIGGLRIESKRQGNTGIEGITYDSLNDRFFAVKEKNPKRIYELKLVQQKPRISYPWSAEDDGSGLKDLSDCYYDSKTRHLLVLSDESRCAVEYDLTGREISRLKLTSGQAGLKKDIPKPEGITMGEDGEIFICSEGNLLYRFSK
jgi:uncharacterized protein YjiK